MEIIMTQSKLLSQRGAGKIKAPAFEIFEVSTLFTEEFDRNKGSHKE
jgi:hypothetical protein